MQIFWEILITAIFYRLQNFYNSNVTFLNILGSRFIVLDTNCANTLKLCIERINMHLLRTRQNIFEELKFKKFKLICKHNKISARTSDGTIGK